MKNKKFIKFLANLSQLRCVLRNLKIHPDLFIFAALFSLAAAIFEGISVGVLIPMVKGIVTMNFTFVHDLTVFKFFFGKSGSFLNLSNTPIFIILLSIIFLSTLLKIILQYASSLIVSLQVRKIADTLRGLTFERYLSFGKLFFDRNNTGYLHSVLLHFSTMVVFQLRGIEQALGNIFLLVVYICIMFVISWKLTLFVIIFFPFLSYALRWLVKKIEKTSLYHAEVYGSLSNKITNILACIPLVKLYTWEEKEKENFAFLSGEMRTIELSMDKKQNLVSPLQEIFMLLSVLFLISFMAFIMVKERSGEVASFLVYIYILKRLQNSFIIVSNLRTSLALVKGPLDNILNVFDDKDKFFVTQGKDIFGGLKQRIEFRHFNFSYVKERQILRDISFLIEKGKVTAIVGPTGSGKTTLMNLLLRFYDYNDGSILIDGCDIKDFTLDSLRKHFVYVSQDIYLFNDTIRNNVVYGLDTELPDEVVTDVIKRARLYDFVASLPKGLNTYVGDRGIKLSGGEKQRISIARALLKGSEILILDEATSSLDSLTERLIQEAINEAIRDRTAIVIAHRLSTIKNADKIIVVDNGNLVEEGSLGELLAKKGKFYEYWQEQKFY